MIFKATFALYHHAHETIVLTTFLEADEAFVLGHSAARARSLTGRTGQGVKATQRAEFRSLFLLGHFCCLKKLRTCWLPAPKRL